MWSASYSANFTCVSQIVLETGLKIGKNAVIRGTDTWTSFVMTFALGVRGARRSEAAIKAATTKQIVVKKPKTFWARVMVVCIFEYAFCTT